MLKARFERGLHLQDQAQRDARKDATDWSRGMLYLRQAFSNRRLCGQIIKRSRKEQESEAHRMRKESGNRDQLGRHTLAVNVYRNPIPWFFQVFGTFEL
jgi:hypothetical protein